MANADGPDDAMEGVMDELTAKLTDLRATMVALDEEFRFFGAIATDVVRLHKQLDEIRSFNCKVAEIGGHDTLNFVDFKSSGIIDDLDISILKSQLDKLASNGHAREMEITEKIDLFKLQSVIRKESDERVNLEKNKLSGGGSCR